jgi:hypothetical protein
MEAFRKDEANMTDVPQMDAIGEVPSGKLVNGEEAQLVRGREAASVMDDASSAASDGVVSKNEACQDQRGSSTTMWQDGTGA